jgi:hypothetical protein
MTTIARPPCGSGVIQAGKHSHDSEAHIKRWTLAAIAPPEELSAGEQEALQGVVHGAFVMVDK